MKTRKFLVIAFVAQFAVAIHGQGTFQFDQQSALGPDREGSYDIQLFQPIGQSFTPSLSSVGVIQLALIGQNSGNNANAVVYVDLLSGSITGQVIGQSQPVTVLIGSEGAVNFLFTTSVAVTPGTVYYLQPVVVSGDAAVNVSSFYHYTGGTSFINGTADASQNFYFREGIVVPEPSTWALLILGGGALFFRRRKAA